MEYRWIEHIDEFIKIKDEWDDALVSANMDNPFLLSDLIVSWWKYYSTDKYLRIFVIKKNGVVKGGIPLYSKKISFGRGMLRRLEYMGDSAANLTEPFYVHGIPSFFDLFIKKVFECGFWDVIILPRIRGHVKNEIVESLRYNKAVKNTVVKDGGINASININQDPETYISTLSKRLRRYLRNCRSSAEKTIGEVVLEKMEQDEIKPYFDLYVNFSIKSYLNRGKQSAFSDKRQRLFFLDLLISLEEKNLLDAHVLKFGENVAAVSFGYRYGKGFKWILTTYNPEFEKLRPGHILISELLREAYLNKDPYFEMYSGREVFYKQQWCNDFAPLYKFLFFNKNILGVSAKQACKFKNLIKRLNTWKQ
jgi:CelD/BcsL family acetyltransferase involved in cellulose biosynthesis